MSVVRGALALAVGAILFSCRDPVPLGGGEGSGPGAIGAACIPSQELSTTFLGFDFREVVVDEGNAACASGVCLVDHFQGRASCPYGQNPTATAADLSTAMNAPCRGTIPAPGSACCTSGGEKPVIASQDVGSAMPMNSEIRPNCVDRLSAKTVTCSCRCANAAGKTDDGAHYCSCPGGFTCTQVVPELDVGDPLAGAYCIANGSAYDSLTSCTGLAGCDPTAQTGEPAYCGPTNAAATTAPADAGAETTYWVTQVQGGAGSRGPCLPYVPPTNASGMATCIVLESLPAGQSCSGTAGLSVPDPAIVASVQQAVQATMPLTLCEVPQLAAPCDTATQPGWCYVSGAQAASMGCTSAIDFSTGFPPAGTVAIVGCY